MNVNAESIIIGEKSFSRQELLKRLALACSWLTDISQVRSDGEAVRRKHIHKSYVGAMKGQYSAATKEWAFSCPVWHTGQAVKALSAAWEILGDNNLLKSAEAGAAFIVENQITDKDDPDYGLILAYEDIKDKPNTSAILEALDGLLTLDRVTGKGNFKETFESAASWIAGKAIINGSGLLKDQYDPGKRAFVENAYCKDGRPLQDDAIFLKAYKLTGNPVYKQIFYKIAERLLADEEPAGNWIKYPPCNMKESRIHPRHAYWWGYPMLDAWLDSKDKKYMECFLRSCRWYAKAQRHDGGIFRWTFTDFKTDSFGHATSGLACAMAMWMDADAITASSEFAPNIAKGLEYCLKMQFTNTADPNLRGVILERLEFPDGTDASPYRIRDLGTIFFIQALSKLLRENKTFAM